MSNKYLIVESIQNYRKPWSSPWHSKPLRILPWAWQSHHFRCGKQNYKDNRGNGFNFEVNLRELNVFLKTESQKHELYGFLLPDGLITFKSGTFINKKTSGLKVLWQSQRRYVWYLKPRMNSFNRHLKLWKTRPNQKLYRRYEEKIQLKSWWLKSIYSHIIYSRKILLYI